MAAKIRTINIALALRIRKFISLNVPYRSREGAVDPWKLCSSRNPLVDKACSEVLDWWKHEYGAIVAASYWGLPFATLLASKALEKSKEERYKCKVFCLGEDVFPEPDSFELEEDERKVFLVDDTVKSGDDINGSLEHLATRYGVKVSQCVAILHNNTYPSQEGLEEILKRQDIEIRCLTLAKPTIAEYIIGFFQRLFLA